jgi:dihydropteroate synthase
MGILNLTPDSFSDGGKFNSKSIAVDHAHKMLSEGADILDLGAESTRPGSKPVSLNEELDRMLPVVESLATDRSIVLSIDTTKAEVAREALKLGAAIINDISAMRFDPEMIDVVSHSDCGVALMHMQGTPESMQIDPVYLDVIREVRAFFIERLEMCAKKEIAENRIVIDPGIGFGKKLEHNLELLKLIDQIAAPSFPILLGVSRKGFIGKITGQPLQQRMLGSVAVASYSCRWPQVAVIRVHDVAETRQAMNLISAIRAPISESELP